ncbi:MAG: DUF4935 domain-containing protein [Parafilimonas sp.]|nr:DUF4935 domain-containing protein [Parafilimonas sp.]
MRIVLDTNIYRRDFALNSNDFKVFIDYLRKTNATLSVPQIVIEELCFLYDMEVDKLKSHLEVAIKNYNQISIDESLCLIKNETQHRITYKEFLFKKLEIHYIDEPNYKNDYLKELVKRGIQKIKPFSLKGEEFRDALLWLTILDYIKQDQYDDNVFISANVKDFADEQRKDLHHILRKELSENNLKLTFFTSLQEFNKTFSLKIDFITTDWINENLDWKRLNEGACKEGNIHCTYFFELYNRRSTLKENLEFYELENAYLDESICEFYVYEIPNGNYAVQIFLSGIIKTKFFIKDTSDSDYISETISTEFGTRTKIEIKDKSIVKYTDEYFEEESGLNFY